MITDDTVARLDQQLTRQGLGPLEAISDQTVAALVSWIRVIATGLSQAARDRPLTALLIALEVGYAIGRSGRGVRSAPGHLHPGVIQAGFWRPWRRGATRPPLAGRLTHQRMAET